MKIEIKDISKSFKDIKALDKVSMTLESGKIYGFVGHNGSGKTVLLKLICAFLEPTTGEILFDGVNVIKENSFPPSTRALIERPNFLSDLTGKENLELLARIQNKIGEKEIEETLELLARIQNKIGEKEIEETLEKVGLKQVENRLYYKYSLGMKQKLGIAQVLMENPDVLILDEPFNGLDEESAKNIRDILLEEKRKGKLIILATHIKEDMELLCDEIYKFNDGVVTTEERKLL